LPLSFFLVSGLITCMSSQVTAFNQAFQYSVVMCGDFNTTPDSQNYGFLSTRTAMPALDQLSYEQLASLLWVLPTSSPALAAFATNLEIPLGDYESLKFLPVGSAERAKAEGELKTLLACDDIRQRLQNIAQVYESNQASPLFLSAYHDYMELVPEHLAPKPSVYFKGEPSYTNYRAGWFSTLDYLFTPHPLLLPLGPSVLLRHRLLEVPKDDVVSSNVALPNDYFSSDHLCVMCEYDLVHVPSKLRGSIPAQWPHHKPRFLTSDKETPPLNATRLGSGSGSESAPASSSSSSSAPLSLPPSSSSAAASSALSRSLNALSSRRGVQTVAWLGAVGLLMTACRHLYRSSRSAN